MATGQPLRIVARCRLLAASSSWCPTQLCQDQPPDWMGHIRGTLAANPVRTPAIPMAALISGKTDRFNTAEAIAAELLSSTSINPGYASSVRIGLALMAVQRSDIVAAAEQFSALESLRGTMTAGFTWSLLSLDRLLGLLSHTLGSLEQATGHFEDALRFCRKARYRPELAWTCCDYAECLIQRNAFLFKRIFTAQLSTGASIFRGSKLLTQGLTGNTLLMKDTLRGGAFTRESEEGRLE